MQLWAEPSTKLRLQQMYNLFRDPCERADNTTNTFWDWKVNHVGSVYDVMGDLMELAATFREFPPRSIQPGFKPSTIMEGTIDGICDAQRKPRRPRNKAFSKSDGGKVTGAARRTRATGSDMGPNHCLSSKSNSLAPAVTVRSSVDCAL